MGKIPDKKKVGAFSKGILKRVLLLVVFALLAIVTVISWQNRQTLEFTQCLNETAFMVDGEAVEMKWLGFYVVYEEGQVETQALIYNPDNSTDYWNLHTDGHFIRQDAKDAIMNMAIHDYLFYCKSQEEGMTLDTEEQRMLENEIADFWMDLLEEQEERLPVTDEYLVESMRRIALAEKYQAQLAEENDHSYDSYNWNGGYYKLWLEDQDVEINERIWDRIRVGDITLVHEETSYQTGGFLSLGE